MAGLAPLTGSVVPRFGPVPPPGFFSFQETGDDTQGGRPSVTLPPRAAVFFRRTSPASGATGLTAGLRAARDVRIGETLFEEELLFVGATTPHAVAAGGGGGGGGGGGPTSGVLIPQLPSSGRSAAAAEFVKGAAAMWRVLAAQHQEQHHKQHQQQQQQQQQSAAAAQFSNVFLDGGDGFGGRGLGDTSAADYADLVASTARAYTVAVAQCMQQLDEPGSAPWARLLGLELRQLCPDKEDAERHVRAAVMLHKLLVAVSTKKNAANTSNSSASATSILTRVAATAEDIAVVHALASEHNLRTHELYPGGPTAMGSFVSAAVAVPFPAAANCKLAVVESFASSEQGATLRVRCVACAAGGGGHEMGDDAAAAAAAAGVTSNVVAIKEGDELRLLRAPLLTGDDAQQARRAHEGNRAQQQPSSSTQHPTAGGGGGPPRLGETEAEAARRKMLAFIGSAKEDPTRMRRLMELQQQQQRA